MALGDGAGSSYPATLDTSTTESDDPGGTSARADVPNDIFDAIKNIEAELGTVPKGSDASVKARFEKIDILTTRGDILYFGASGYERKALGASGLILGSNGTDLTYIEVDAVKIQGRDFQNVTPSDGEVPVWSTSNSRWEPGSFDITPIMQTIDTTWNPGSASAQASSSLGAPAGAKKWVIGGFFQMRATLEGGDSAVLGFRLTLDDDTTIDLPVFSTLGADTTVAVGGALASIVTGSGGTAARPDTWSISSLDGHWIKDVKAYYSGGSGSTNINVQSIKAIFLEVG